MDLKQVPGLKKTKMVMYSVTTTLNSTFGTTGKATADKMTGKVVGKISGFRFSVKNEFHMLSCEVRLRKFEHF